MLTAMAWLFGAVGLLAGIVLSVMAIGQVVFGPGPLLVPIVLGGAAAFVVAWGCSRHIDAARKERRQRLDVMPQPIAVPEGELVLRMRWGKWLSAVLVLGGCAAFGAFALATTLRGGKPGGIILAGFVVAVLVPSTLLLLETARRAWGLGGIARLDAQGFQHCLLPLVAWKQVRGIDLELQFRRDIKQWNLVLAIDAALVPVVRLAWWWRALGAGAPRVDSDGRLTVPMVYVRGQPQDTVGKAMAVADRWGAHRIPSWRAFLPPDMAASLHAAKVSSEDATRTMQRLMQELRARKEDQPLTEQETQRVLDRANRSLQDADRVYEEQMKLFRAGVRK